MGTSKSGVRTSGTIDGVDDGHPLDGQGAELAEENAALRRRLAEAGLGRRRAHVLCAGAPVGLLLLDELGTVVECNSTAASQLGLSHAQLVGAPLASRVEAADHEVFLRHLRLALRGAPDCACQVSFARPRSGSFPAYVESAGSTDSFGRRRVRTAVSAAAKRFVEERAHAERLERERALRDEVEAAQRRLDRVAALGALVSESLDLDDIAARATRAPLPELATFCAIDLVDGGGRVRRAASATAEGYPSPPIDPYAPRGSMSVVRTGEALILPSPAAGDILGLCADPADLGELWKTVRSYLCLPLRARGRVLGAMTFVRAAGAAYAPPDVTVAVEMARHAAAVIQGAQLYHAAQEADRLKDEFLAMLGHELRNPLAAIVLATARLRAASSPAGKAVEIVDRQSQRLTRLIDDLLDVSRISRGMVTLRRGPVSLGAVIDAAVESVRPALLARRHHLSVRAPAGPVVFDGDAARIEQVLVNLLGNAARYTEPGGHVAVEGGREGDEVVVRVRDDGIGMDRETLARVFDPFTRFAASLEHGDRGLGIGLTLSRALVELHGGRLTADSAGPGAGSELSVHLPAGPARAPAPAPSPAAECRVRRAPVRLLLVEDEPDVAEVTRERLAAPSREVRVARDGIEAVSTAVAFRPELLIVDLGLPGMSGFEVARRLRREDALAGATFVALSGYGDEGTRRRCVEAGFDCHLTKPIDDEALRLLLDGSQASAPPD